jgi:superfamily II DNA or RNA helicase
MLKGNSRWDGMIHYINQSGKFRIGLLPSIYNRLMELGHKVNILDEREPLPTPVLPRVVGALTLREKQLEVLGAILKNKVGSVPYLIGVQDLSVNFGKSLIMAAIHQSFKGKLKTLLITNDSDWLEQSKKEFPELIKEPITFIRGGKVTNWSNFSIGMVQSISQNIKTYQKELSKVDIVLIDECDLSDNKTYKTVIEHLWNTRVRIGLSGTIYMSKLKKDVITNMNIRSFLGDIVTQVKLIDTMDSGDSTRTQVKIIPSNYNLEKKKYKTYPEEYDAVITDNKLSYQLSFKRAMYNYDRGRHPMIVVTKYKRHCELLYKFYKRKLEADIKIAWVHSGVNTKTRNKIISDFRDGKIDILISNSFISRGKNFPLLRYLQNTASMDSNEKMIQILGRLVRTHESKKKSYMDDIAFNGKYLTKHANHRKRYYKKEGLKVITVRVK